MDNITDFSGLLEAFNEKPKPVNKNEIVKKITRDKITFEEHVIYLKNGNIFCTEAEYNRQEQIKLLRKKDSKPLF